MRQKRLDFAGTHLARVPHSASMARPANEEAGPVDVHLLGAEAIVHVPDALAQLVQNAAGLQQGVLGFTEFLYCTYIQHIERQASIQAALRRDR